MPKRNRTIPQQTQNTTYIGNTNKWNTSWLDCFTCFRNQISKINLEDPPPPPIQIYIQSSSTLFSTTLKHHSAHVLRISQKSAQKISSCSHIRHSKRPRKGPIIATGCNDPMIALLWFNPCAPLGAESADAYISFGHLSAAAGSLCLKCTTTSLRRKKIQIQKY